MRLRLSSWIDRYIGSENRLNGWRIIEQGVLAWNPHLGRFLKKFPLEWIFYDFVDIFNFFRQAAPIELMWEEIARTVQKLFILLFKLEIPIGGPI